MLSKAATTTQRPLAQFKTRAKPVIYPESDGKPMGETDFHITLITESIAKLRTRFDSQPDVYVVGDILFFYEEGNPKAFIVPDVMVIFSSHKTQRASYKLWEEGVAPTVVIEVSSKKTYKRDLEAKKDLYERLEVAEYYITDPMQPGQRCLKEPLLAYWLSPRGRYVKQAVLNGRIHSPALGLELVHDGTTLHYYDPVTQRFLPNLAEAVAEKERAEAARQAAEAARQAAEAARQAAEAARQAAEAARQTAEDLAAAQQAENERLRAELARLKQSFGD